MHSLAWVAGREADAVGAERDLGGQLRVERGKGVAACLHSGGVANRKFVLETHTTSQQREGSIKPAAQLAGSEPCYCNTLQSKLASQPNALVPLLRTALTSRAHVQGGTTWWSCTSRKLRMAFTLDSSSRVCRGTHGSQTRRVQGQSRQRLMQTCVPLAFIAGGWWREGGGSACEVVQPR